jgi:dTDP-4-dehydrorhamnose reductase
MLKLSHEKDEVRVVDYEILTPTATKEIAHQILQLVENPVYGICHATAEGQCTWYEFTKEIFNILHWDVNLNVAAPGEFPTTVNRPTYSVLENKVLKSEGINTFRHWKEGLKDYLLQEKA